MHHHKYVCICFHFSLNFGKGYILHPRMSLDLCIREQTVEGCLSSVPEKKQDVYKICLNKYKKKYIYNIFFKII